MARCGRITCPAATGARGSGLFPQASAVWPAVARVRSDEHLSIGQFDLAACLTECVSAHRLSSRPARGQPAAEVLSVPLPERIQRADNRS